MYHTYRNAHECACDCGCPAHHSQTRSTYNDPSCHCLTICASQPMTLLAPQINSAMFLDRSNVLWYVPGLEPGHWDWRNASPVSTGHPLYASCDVISDLLYRTHDALLPLIHGA